MLTFSVFVNAVSALLLWRSDPNASDVGASTTTGPTPTPVAVNEPIIVAPFRIVAVQLYVVFTLFGVNVIDALPPVVFETVKLPGIENDARQSPPMPLNATEDTTSGAPPVSAKLSRVTLELGTCTEPPSALPFNVTLACADPANPSHMIASAQSAGAKNRRGVLTARKGINKERLPKATCATPRSEKLDKMPPHMTETPSGLKYEDSVVGTGESPKQGQTCVMHYTGWLWENGAKGKKFDSSVDRNQPFTFPLGQGRVIAGWDEGIATMKIGGKRTLYIKPELGYGTRGAGGGLIPANATLCFDVELLGVK
jgi:peptidylprolyl isomerase